MALNGARCGRCCATGRRPRMRAVVRHRLGRRARRAPAAAGAPRAARRRGAALPRRRRGRGAAAITRTPSRCVPVPRTCRCALPAGGAVRTASPGGGWAACRPSYRRFFTFRSSLPR
ncbi:hypothetical protein ACRAWF_09140 [Streptomyces sp. L7]